MNTDIIKSFKPKFVSFEGGEGSGKSTQSRMLYDYLKANDIKVKLTREVGGTKEAEEIRQLLVHSNLYNVSELMLVMAGRYEHINNFILPTLAEGYWVICDRFVDSTACYQADGVNLAMEDIFALHGKLMRSATIPEAEALLPDVTFFMDLIPEVGLERSKQSGDVNKFENKEIAFHKAVYERFKTLATIFPERIKSVQCLYQSAEEIHQSVVEVLAKSGSL